MGLFDFLKAKKTTAETAKNPPADHSIAQGTQPPALARLPGRCCSAEVLEVIPRKYVNIGDGRIAVKVEPVEEWPRHRCAGKIPPGRCLKGPGDQNPVLPRPAVPGMAGPRDLA